MTKDTLPVSTENNKAGDRSRKEQRLESFFRRLNVLMTELDRNQSALDNAEQTRKTQPNS